MTSLERWQRHLQANPCDICGGYGAYKPENRCKGFRSLDGKGTYCSRISDGRSPMWFETIQENLYFHPKEEEGELDRHFRAEHRNRRTGVLGYRSYGELRRLKRYKEASTKPTWKDWA